MKYTEIDHHDHPGHTLILNSVQEPYYCNGCLELGFKPCYQCPIEACRFHLHEECARAPPSVIHPFLKKCNFIFHEESSAARRCDGCGKDILGYIYQCLHEQAHDLHPCCVKLPHTLKGDGVELRLTNKVSKKCLKCENKEISSGLTGWSYVSTCGQYCYHVACVKDLVLENWSKSYFNRQTRDSIDESSSSSSLALQTMVPFQEMALVNGESSRRRTTNKYLTMAKVVLKLIISAIFGDPISGFAAVIESLSIKGD